MYIIDNKVIFDPEKNILQGTVDHAGIEDELARPTSRLLLELIMRKNQIVTREELLTLVWSDYGGIPSESNLNNHLTLLRKRFDFWGVDRKTILTIPRKGIMLQATITELSKEKISPDREGTSAEESVLPHQKMIEDPLASKAITKPEPTATALTLPRDRKTPHSSQSMVRVIMVSVIILLLFTAYNVKKLPPAYKKHDYFSLGQCRVYPLKSGFIQLKTESRDAISNALNALVNDNKVSCQERKDLYVARRPYNQSYYVYVSECKFKNPTKYTSCQGYLFLEK